MGEAIRVLDEDDADYGAVLAEVLQLSKRNSRTLGFLTNEAFTDRVRSHQLVVALVDDAVVGFTLFDLPRTGKITLRQVCVSARVRGSGIARRMVDLVVSRHPERIELAADCREDYGLEGFWHSLGLSPRGERPGRRQLGSILTRWRRPLGPLDLFEANVLSSELPLAVLDSNVITDLYGAPHVERAQASESRALLQPWVGDHLNLAVSARVDTEIQRTVDDVQRQALRTGSQGILRLRGGAPGDSALEDELSAHLASHRKTDASLDDDLLHLADAIRAEAAYFVTNDGNLIKSAEGWLLADYEIEAIRPHVLMGRTRSHLGQPSFIPRLIASVDLDWTGVEQFSDVLIQNCFTSHAARERGKALLQRIANVSVQQEAQTKVLRNGSEPWALLSFRYDRSSRSLDVPILRVRPGDQALTVALQLTRYIRRIASGASLLNIAVTDPHLQDAVAEALREDGYEGHEGAWHALPRAGTIIDPTLTPASAADHERRHYPLSVLGTTTECAVVPIQPNHADNLLGYGGDTLFQMRRTALGILRQHVYFHAAGGPELTVPSRLLWYVTSDGLGTKRRIVAKSRVIASETLAADEAHEIYGHLGVLNRSAIRDVANSRGDVHVVRFEDTELLTHEVDRAQLAELKRRYEVHGNFQTIRKVPPGFFDDVMGLQPEEER